MKLIAAFTVFSAGLLVAQQPTTSYLVAREGSVIDNHLVSLDRKWEDQQGVHFTFTNHYTKPITALLLFVARFGPSGKQLGQAVRTFDSLVNRVSDIPIESGKQGTITIGMFNFKSGERHTAEMAAAIFGDGTTSGDPRAIQIVQGMRQMTAEMLPAVISILSQAQGNGENIEWIRSHLNNCEQTMSSKPHDKYAGGVPHLVVGDALDNLKTVEAKPAELNPVVSRLIAAYKQWLTMFG